MINVQFFPKKVDVKKLPLILNGKGYTIQLFEGDNFISEKQFELLKTHPSFDVYKNNEGIIVKSESSQSKTETSTELEEKPTSTRKKKLE